MLIDLYFQTKLLSKLDHFHVASPTPKLSKVGASYTEFIIKIVFLSHRWSFDKGVRGDGGTGGQNPTIGAPREGNICNICNLSVVKNMNIAVDMARVECPAELVRK